MKAVLQRNPRSDISCPTHVAIIMDGNGRWAKANNLPRTAGHQRGAKSAKEAVRCAMDMAIPYLTLYGFHPKTGNDRPTK